MAESLWEWSRTAATNASADSGINWAEGMSPAAINNSARGMMAALAKYLYDQSGQIVTAGSSTVYTATTTSGLGSYAEGRMLCVEMDETCGATPTMNVDGLGAKKLYRYGSGGVVQIAANELRAGGRYILQYDTSLDAAAGGWVVLNASIAVSAADIANDAITYAKIQNVAADDRVLGRVSGAGGDIEELTITQVLDLADATRGTVLYRGAAAWAGLDPSTVGYVLRDGGSGADPSWVGGMTLLNSGTASAAAVLDITLPTGYRFYRLVLGAGFYPSTDATSIALRLSFDNGSTFSTTTYSWTSHFSTTASAYGNLTGFSNNDAGTWQGTACPLSVFAQDNGRSDACWFEAEIYPGNANTGAQIKASSMVLNSTATANSTTYLLCNHGTDDTPDAIRILSNSGNINGPWALYGIS